MAAPAQRLDRGAHRDVHVAWMLGAPTAFLVLALPPLSRVASRTISHAEAMPRADEEGDARGEWGVGG